MIHELAAVVGLHITHFRKRVVMRIIQRLWVGLCVCSSICLGGCTRVFELPNAHVDALVNPKSGPVVKVVKVTDLRKFEADPPNILTPTVQNNDDIANPSITARAIGKGKVNGYTIFYIYPNNGPTVETAVQGAVENALREKGYVVAADGSADAAGAIPVEVGIRKFWLTLDEGFWTIEADYAVEVEITSPALLNGTTESVTASYYINSAFMVPSICEHCIGEGLDQLSINVQPKLKAP
jgi:hypothetical protein